MDEMIDITGAGPVVLAYLLVFLLIWALTELAAWQQRRDRHKRK
jgi:cytochrome oxidase assembly protein ShyY1